MKITISYITITITITITIIISMKITIVHTMKDGSASETAIEFALLSC